MTNARSHFFVVTQPAVTPEIGLVKHWPCICQLTELFVLTFS